MRPDQSVSQNIMHIARNAREHAELQATHRKEVEATRSLFVSLRRKLGSESRALEELKKRGYNPHLLK